jgi:hypothetical protein
MLHRACLALGFAAMTQSIAPDAPAASPTRLADVPATGCIVTGGGYLRARLRGELSLDLDWKNADMHCEGGPRPSGNGVRVSIGGPDRGDGRRIRMVFGIAGIGEAEAGSALPTNVTILFEGEKRIFATQGDDKCTVDSLHQERLEPLGPGPAVYRVTARGFCLGPASDLAGGARLILTSFDFAGRVEFEDDDRHAPVD